MQKLHDAYANRGLTVLAFSIDRTEQAAKDYLAKRGYTFNVAMRSADADRWFGRNRGRRKPTSLMPRAKSYSYIAARCFREDIAALSRFAVK